MKKLIPLLVIAAGAVAYSVYKSKKETVNEEEDKTLVVIDDSSSDETHPEEPENPMKEVEEAVQEVQEELGVFETLSDVDEPYERPSFFHLTDDSYLEPEEPVHEEEPVTVEVETENVEEPVDAPEESTDAPEEILEEVPALIVLDTEERAEVPAVEEVIEEPVEEAMTVEELPQQAEEAVEEVQEEYDDVFVPFFDLGSAKEPEEELTVEDAIDEIVQKVEEAVEEPEEVVVEDFVETMEPEEELEPLPSYDTPEVDELMKTIAGQVKAADVQESVEEPVGEEEPVTEEVVSVEESEETDYLQDIRRITEMYSDKVAQYNIRYPYLSSRFIDDTLKFSQQFNAEYPQGTRVAIEHHSHFDAVEDLFIFAQIIRQSGYSVKEGAEDGTLIVTKEMMVDTNTILHDVFKVANQVYCLSGEYLKFRITKR